MTPTSGKRKLEFTAPNPAPQNRAFPAGQWRLRQILPLACLLLSLHGCGGSSFTGGGVPIGKAALVGGGAVRASSANVPLYNTLITVTATPSQGAVQTLQARTDHNGCFRIENIPTDAVTGRVTIRATTPEDSGYSPQQFDFLLSNQHTATIVFAMPSSDYRYKAGTTLSLVPSASEIQAGQKVTFTAKVLDANGIFLPVTPTLFFEDDFGILKQRRNLYRYRSGNRHDCCLLV